MKNENEHSVPLTETIGTTTVSTFLDDSLGLQTFRTQVSSAESLVKADLWSTEADTLEVAVINHYSGRIQAADVEIQRWLRANPRGAPPESITQAGDIIGIRAEELAALHARAPEEAEKVRRKAAASRIADLS